MSADEVEFGSRHLVAERRERVPRVVGDMSGEAEDPKGLAHELDPTHPLPSPPRSPEMIEGMRAFLEKRPPRWPRD